MSSIYNRSLNIPESIRPDVFEVVERTRNQVQFTNADLSYLFEVYNRYLAPPEDQQDMNCGGCRTRVIGWLRSAATEWQKNGIVNG